MSNDESCCPFEQQKIFGAGIKTKTIKFVPAAEASRQAIHSAPRTIPSISPGDLYLNIVLKNSASAGDHISTSAEAPDFERITQQKPPLNRAICEICNLPIDPSGPSGDTASTLSTNHESTIAHMVCLTHSHPPSHLDRSRQGFKYLSSFGWDPDSRQGLGAAGEGIRAPIRATVKNDTVGLGVKVNGSQKPPDTKLEQLDAKQVRKRNMEDRQKWERLQDIFYGNDDVEKYLGLG